MNSDSNKNPALPSYAGEEALSIARRYMIAVAVINVLYLLFVIYNTYIIFTVRTFPRFTSSQKAMQVISIGMGILQIILLSKQISAIGHYISNSTVGNFKHFIKANYHYWLYIGILTSIMIVFMLVAIIGLGMNAR